MQSCQAWLAFMYIGLLALKPSSFVNESMTLRLKDELQLQSSHLGSLSLSLSLSPGLCTFSPQAATPLADSTDSSTETVTHKAHNQAIPSLSPSSSHLSVKVQAYLCSLQCISLSRDSRGCGPAETLGAKQKQPQKSGSFTIQAPTEALRLLRPCHHFGKLSGALQTYAKGRWRRRVSLETLKRGTRHPCFQRKKVTRVFF